MTLTTWWTTLPLPSRKVPGSKGGKYPVQNRKSVIKALNPTPSGRIRKNSQIIWLTPSFKEYQKTASTLVPGSLLIVKVVSITTTSYLVDTCYCTL